MAEKDVGTSASLAQTLPLLPVDVWVRILQLCTADSLIPLRELVRLQLINRTVFQAVRSVPLAVNVESDVHLDAIRPFLLVCPCRRLDFHRKVDGESLLRDPVFRTNSQRALKGLRAVVACTDTLASFPLLESLTLEAGAINRFYPSVLGGLTQLRSLWLVRFPLMEVGSLPPNAVVTMTDLQVTPLPLALRCFFSLQLPPALRLDTFCLHGSFADIVGPPSAPVVTCRARTLATQIRNCRIEAQTLRISLPWANVTRPPGAADLLRALSCEGALWRQLEFCVLDHKVWMEPQRPGASDESALLDDRSFSALVAPNVALEPEDLLVAAAAMPTILATLSWEQAGICHFPVIALIRVDYEDGEGEDC